ncbi:hypothetical protein VPNG_06503 [Cytospora leucostoma]|uniref:Uncharacterized protein n=1 Tax=Cytospora leucostoma TaxID=1230097 RepID=A0A423X268_9PEZI|nr:hypothetical protein VPNG_06503 [Cytospora leucostoma]
MSVPPVEKDGFSYAVDSLYREASNHSRHRRATVPELKAHFSGKDTENRPGHWYEAQLLHYGLPPSKVKGTAHKRLFDAVTGKGGLTVPEHIKKIEADLKKEWNKKEREAKKVIKSASGAAAAAPAKGTKRKAEQASTNVNVNVSVQVSQTGAVKVDTVQPAAKRAKASGPSSASTTSKKTTTVASKAKKTTSTKSQKAVPAGKTAPPPKPAKPATKARAPAKSTTRRPAAPRTTSTQVPGVAPRSSQGGYDDDQSGDDYYSDGYDHDGYGSYTEQPQSEDYGSQPSPRRSLGILNGRYEVSCPLLEDNFPEYMNDYALIATLDGHSLWLKFDFGPATGLIKVERPYEASEDGVMAFWRGFAFDRDNKRRFFNVDTIYRAGPVNRLYFLGGGHIEGVITYDGIEVRFDAYRLPGQSMTSEISPSQARAEWARLEQNVGTYW